MFHCLKLYTTVDILQTIIFTTISKKRSSKTNWWMFCLQISKVATELKLTCNQSYVLLTCLAFVVLVSQPNTLLTLLFLLDCPLDVELLSAAATVFSNSGNTEGQLWFKCLNPSDFITAAPKHMTTFSVFP